VNTSALQAHTTTAHSGGHTGSIPSVQPAQDAPRWPATLEAQRRLHAPSLGGTVDTTAGGDAKYRSSPDATPLISAGEKKPAVKQAEDKLAGHVSQSAAEEAAQEMRTPDEDAHTPRSPHPRAGAGQSDNAESSGLPHAQGHDHDSERSAQTRAADGQAKPRGAQNHENNQTTDGAQHRSGDTKPPAMGPHAANQNASGKAAAASTSASGVTAAKGAGTEQGGGRAAVTAQAEPTQRQAGAQRVAQFKGLMHAARAASEAAEERTLVHQMGAGVNRALKAAGPITMVLRPEHLGEVTVKVSMTDEHVRAEFIVRTELARDLLISTSHELRASLEQKGLTVSEVHIRLGAPDGAMDNPTGAQEGHEDGAAAAGSRDHPGGSHGREPDADDEGERTDAFAPAGEDGAPDTGVLRMERDLNGQMLVRLNALA
jgi:flagellar hook-length control protein FliK